MLKKLIRILFVTSVILCLLTCSAVVGGEGDCTEISSEEDLAKIASNLSGSYKLTKDITLTKEWTAIGNSVKFFTGILDGNGHTISGLKVTKRSDYKGFFGYTKRAEIKNLTLEGEVDVYSAIDPFTAESFSYIGMFAGGAVDTVFTDCTFIGSVTGNDCVGGICGRALGCTFTNCSARGRVYGDSDVGGICGRIAGCTLKGCSFTGSVEASSHGGGLVGQLYAYKQSGTTYATSSISGCYGNGNVTVAYQQGGGLIGYALASASSVLMQGTVADCYFNGSVSSDFESASLGGLIGEATTASGSTLTVSRCYTTSCISNTTYAGALFGSDNIINENCFYLSGTLKASPQIAGNGLTADQMKQASSFTGFDFSAVWHIGAGYPYPQLAGNAQARQIMALSLQTRPAVYAYLLGDTSLSTTGLTLRVLYNDGTAETVSTGFTTDAPAFRLGLNRVPVHYNGSTTFFDIVVYNSYSERDTLADMGNYIPLYSAENIADIALNPNADYYLMNDISGIHTSVCSLRTPFTGIFLGNDHTLELNINGNGLFAFTSGAVFQDMTVTGQVSGKGCVGGVAAMARNTNFTRCNNKAAITATEKDLIAYGGGLCGYLDSTSTDTTTVSQCFNRGSISVSGGIDTGNASAGGLIGLLSAGANSNALIKESYNAGSILSQNDCTAVLGGVVGTIVPRTGISHVTVSTCFNTGTLDGISTTAVTTRKLNAGGVVGYYLPSASSVANSTMEIYDCFNAGNVSVLASGAITAEGGIISALNHSKLTVARVYNVGTVKGTALTLYSGSLCSSSEALGTLSDGYYLSPAAAGEGKYISAAEAVSADTYKGFAFNTVWFMGQDYLHPQLKAVPMPDDLLIPFNEILTLSGEAVCGETLSVSLAYDALYQWERDGEPIHDAVTNSYTLTEDDADTTVSVKIARPGLYKGQVTLSADVAPLPKLASEVHTITEDAILLASPDLTVSKFLSDLTGANAAIACYRNGVLLVDTDVIGSLCTVVNGKDSYTVYLSGDLDGDGHLTYDDHTALRKALLKDPTTVDKRMGDFNGDDVIDLKDSVLLRQAIPAKTE